MVIEIVSFLKVRKLAVTLIFSGLALQATSLPDLTAEADVIVVGSISTRVEGSESVSFSINVDKVLKGDTTMRSVDVAHRWKGLIISGANQTVDVQISGIWFLCRTQTSQWEALNVNGRDGIMGSLVFPASPGRTSSVTRLAATSLLDSVVLEVVAGFENQTKRGAILATLEGVDTPVVHQVFDNFSSSGVLELQVTGVQGLLASSQQGAINRLIELWPVISKDVPTRAALVSALSDSYRQASSGSIQQLKQLAGASSTERDLRAAAIKALVAIHSKDSVPTLATLLSSQDQEERMQGVFGLSSFVNGCPSQTRKNVATMEYLRCTGVTSYKNDETEAAFAFRRGPIDQEMQLISFWSKWWGAYKSEFSE